MAFERLQKEERVLHVWKVKCGKGHHHVALLKSGQLAFEGCSVRHLQEQKKAAETELTLLNIAAKGKAATRVVRYSRAKGCAGWLINARNMMTRYGVKWLNKTTFISFGHADSDRKKPAGRLEKELRAFWIQQLKNKPRRELRYQMYGVYYPGHRGHVSVRKMAGWDRLFPKTKTVMDPAYPGPGAKFVLVPFKARDSLRDGLPGASYVHHLSSFEELEGTKPDRFGNAGVVLTSPQQPIANPKERPYRVLVRDRIDRINLHLPWSVQQMRFLLSEDSRLFVLGRLVSGQLLSAQIGAVRMSEKKREKSGYTFDGFVWPATLRSPEVLGRPRLFALKEEVPLWETDDAMLARAIPALLTRELLPEVQMPRWARWSAERIVTPRYPTGAKEATVKFHQLGRR